MSCPIQICAPVTLAQLPPSMPMRCSTTEHPPASGPFKMLSLMAESYPKHERIACAIRIGRLDIQSPVKNTISARGELR